MLFAFGLTHKKAYTARARSCLQLKHQVSDLEREAQRAREDRHEELETSKKRMERPGTHVLHGNARITAWKVMFYMFFLSFFLSFCGFYMFLSYKRAIISHNQLLG